MYEILFVFTPRYTKVFWETPGLGPRAEHMLFEWLFLRSTLAGIGLVCVAVFRSRPSERPLVVALVATLCVLLAGVVMQAKFYEYHWNAIFPALALLAVIGLARAADAATKRGWPYALAMALVLTYAATYRNGETRQWDREIIRKLGIRFDIVTGRMDAQAGWDAVSSFDNDYAAQNRLAGAYLAARVPKDAPIFIWGFEPVVYDISGLPIASRYIYDVPQRASWSATESQAILMDDLRQHPPAAILVQHFDSVSTVTGFEDDSAIALNRFPALKALLAARYTFDIKIGSLDVYVARNPPTDH
jgi:hypothetical protein